MNTEHLDDTVLQQIAIYKEYVSLNAMEHYNACITCQDTAKKYSSMLETLRQEKRPALSVTSKQMILAGLPPQLMPHKNYRLVILISASILVCLCLLFFLMSEYRKRLPAIASIAALIIVASIVIQEFIERYYRYEQQLDDLSAHHQAFFKSLK